MQGCIGRQQAQQQKQRLGFAGHLRAVCAHRAQTSRPVDLPALVRAGLGPEVLHGQRELALHGLVVPPGEAALRAEQPRITSRQRAPQRRSKQTAPADHPRQRHRRVGRVGRVLTTYKGLPMAMPMVTARYSAITPRAVRMQPEKNATMMSNEAQPSTGTEPVNLP